MAKIECLSAIPYLRFTKPGQLRLLKAIASQGDRCTVFLFTERNGAAFDVKELYVPKQSCGTSQNIVQEEELNILKKGYGVCCCLGNTVSCGIDANSEKTFKAFFGPLKEQIRMNMTKSGSFYVDIVLGDFVVKEASVVNIDPMTQDDVDKAKKVLKEQTTAWNYKDGCDQPPRIIYETPDFIAKNYDWRKLVGVK